MPNITIQVSEELYQHARLSAARRNMTVSALLRALLLTLPQDPGQETPEGQRFEDRFKTMSELYREREAEELVIEQHRKSRSFIDHARY